jgi:hypothetical protein
MDDLVKKHPLYGQLAQYESNIEALNLSALVPHALAAGPELKREEQQLDAQLSAAAKRTDALLAAKGKSYQERENKAIEAALRGAAANGGPSVAQISAQMEGTAHAQAGAAGAQAMRTASSSKRKTWRKSTPRSRRWRRVRIAPTAPRPTNSVPRNRRSRCNSPTPMPPSGSRCARG